MSDDTSVHSARPPRIRGDQLEISPPTPQMELGPPIGNPRTSRSNAWFDIRRQWVLLVACAATSLALSWVYTEQATPMYRSTTQLLFSARHLGGEQPEDIVTGLSLGTAFSSGRVATYAVLATSSEVLGRVIRDVSSELTEAELRGRVTVEADPTSATMTISVQDPDPVTAADAANLLSAELARLVAELESSNAAGTSPVDVRVIRTAGPSSVPIWPRMDFNLAVGLVAGLVVGIGLATMRDQLDTKIRGEQQVFEVVLRPPLASLPRAVAGRVKHGGQPAESAARAQAVTRLRLNLGVGTSAGAATSLLVTGPRRGTGSSALATDLASDCTRAGMRVLVVDCDLRAAGLSAFWGMTEVAGLTDAIFGLAAPDVVPQLGPGGLRVVAAGRGVPNPTELLGSSAMAALVARWSSEYDVVVLDGGPLVGVADTLTFVPYVDGVLCVVRDGVTRRADLAEAVALVGAVRGRLAGVVLDGAPGEGAERKRLFGRAGDAKVRA